MTGKSAARGAPYFKVRRSRVHGRGAFALRRIRKGTRIIEYLGERVTHQEADRRYEDRGERDNHTFLFIVDARTVIDAGVGGNDARFINHSCGPNCEAVIEGKRVFIEAIRTIQPGEELNYDYQLGRSADDPPDVDEIYACRCGQPDCRGTMLWPAKKNPPRRASAGKRPGKRPKKASRGASHRRSAR
ncbi:MAG: SET domain-containing protein [Steroidobacteraceae bacterium]